METQQLFRGRQPISSTLLIVLVLVLLLATGGLGL